MNQVTQNINDTSINELQTLFDSLIDLLTEIEILKLRVSPLVENMFYSKLGEFQVAVKTLEFDVFRNKRKIDLINATISKEQPVDFKAIESKLNSEFLVWESKIRKIKSQFLNSNKIQGIELNDFENYKIKEICRNIITHIHPDLHIQQEEAKSNLYKKSQELFQSGNIIELKEVVEKIKNQKSSINTNNFNDLTDDEISILTKQYLFLINIKKNEREKILNSFPLAFIDLISDSEWIESRKNDLERIRKELLSQNNLLLQILTFIHYDINYGQFSQN